MSRSFKSDRCDSLIATAAFGTFRNCKRTSTSNLNKIKIFPLKNTDVTSRLVYSCVAS